MCAQNDDDCERTLAIACEWLRRHLDGSGAAPSVAASTVFPPALRTHQAASSPRSRSLADAAELGAACAEAAIDRLEQTTAFGVTAYQLVMLVYVLCWLSPLAVLLAPSHGALLVATYYYARFARSTIMLAATDWLYLALFGVAHLLLIVRRSRRTKIE